MTLTFGRMAVVLSVLILLDAATTTLGVLRYGNAVELNAWVLNRGIVGLWIVKACEAGFCVGITALMGRSTRNLIILSAGAAFVVLWNVVALTRGTA